MAGTKSPSTRYVCIGGRGGDIGFPVSSEAMDLRGKVVVITGGARRVGRAIALEMARVGANVVVHCHTSHVDAATTCAAVLALGVQAAVVTGDLGMSADVERIA